MKRFKKYISRVSIILLLQFVVVIPNAGATGIPVFDAGNFSQNVLSAIRDLMSNLNEARMIAHQVESLSNQFKNLTSLPDSIADDYANQFTQLYSKMGQVHGMASNLANLEEQFEEYFPQYEMKSKIGGEAVSAQTKKWLELSRNSMLRSSMTSAKIIEDLPRSQANVEKLLDDSDNSVGILQAAQAGNQISAVVAGNLTNLNAQLATQSQAYNSVLMQINTANSASKNRMEHVLDGYVPLENNKVRINSF